MSRCCDLKTLSITSDRQRIGSQARLCEELLEPLQDSLGADRHPLGSPLVRRERLLQRDAAQDEGRLHPAIGAREPALLDALLLPDLLGVQHRLA